MKEKTYTEKEVLHALCDGCRAGLNSVGRSNNGGPMIWDHQINGNVFYCTASIWRHFCASKKLIDGHDFSKGVKAVGHADKR